MKGKIKVKLMLSKLFITFNLCVVALGSSAFEVNLSPASLMPGVPTHGNVLFEANDGRIKFGPTLGVDFSGLSDDSIMGGFRMEFYSELSERQSGSYFMLGSFIPLLAKR